MVDSELECLLEGSLSANLFFIELSQVSRFSCTSNIILGDYWDEISAITKGGYIPEDFTSLPLIFQTLRY